MIYLYLKTHKITGKKYFGKTVQDPFTYSGELDSEEFKDKMRDLQKLSTISKKK